MVCGHSSRDHYAKGLCSSCYMKEGRMKKPWNCPHDKLFALGLCKSCYLTKYNMVITCPFGNSIYLLIGNRKRKTVKSSPTKIKRIYHMLIRNPKKEYVH